MVKAAGQPRVLVVTGGSGGHIFPALAFCEECAQERGASLTLVAVLKGRGAQEVPLREMLRTRENTLVVEAARSVAGFTGLFFSSLSLLRRLRPDIVIGFGGYGCLPFLFWAKASGKKTVLHEQNVMPGRANRLAAFFVSKIAVTFAASGKYFGGRRVALARFPLRPSLKRLAREEAERSLGLKPGLFNVLVIGGSQGARRLNELFVAALKNNRDLGGLQVIHLAGKGQAAAVDAAYADLDVARRVMEFLPEVERAYGAADMVVGRAGAGAVVELMYFGLPSILVPYPHAAGHQVQNARVLAEAGAAILLEESKWTDELFNGLLDIFRQDAMRRKTMAHLAAQLYAAPGPVPLGDVVFS